MKLKIILSILIIVGIANNANAKCRKKGSCEQPLAKMSQNVRDYIEESFDNLDTQINALEKEYALENKELDKEIYVLQVALKGEQTLYRKMSNIEAELKKNVKLKDNHISAINILEEIKENREGMENEKK